MSPGYESPYSGLTPNSTRQNGNNERGNINGQEQASPASPPHSYSPLPQVYNGMSVTRQNGGNVQQNISINTSAPSPTLSAQSAELNSPSDQQMDKLWNGKMMESPSNVHHNGSQTSFVQIGGQHHIQATQHHHSQNNRELLSGGDAISPIPQGIMQRVRNFIKVAILKKNY